MVGITRDVDNYCRRCSNQAAKHVTPTKAPLANTSIGWPWQMVAADILGSWTHTGRGGWRVREMKGPLTIEISNGPRIKCVHVNRLHHRLQPAMEEQPVPTKTITPPWQAPQTDHCLYIVDIHMQYYCRSGVRHIHRLCQHQGVPPC